MAKQNFVKGRHSEPTLSLVLQDNIGVVCADNYVAGAVVDEIEYSERLLRSGGAWVECLMRLMAVCGS